MAGPLFVLLPPVASHLAGLVLEAGAVPVIDATGPEVPTVPDGAWVRTRPGRPAPGTGPVVLAEHGVPLAGRPTWLETAEARDVPQGFAGLILKGREAAGIGGEVDGLELLAMCPDRSRVILDAGVGPAATGSAAALGAAGVWLGEQHLGCPELALPPALNRRLDLPDDEITHIASGMRVANAPTSPVLRRLIEGADPWVLADGLWRTGDASKHLWFAGQGLALARGLAERHGTLARLIHAYLDAWRSWPAAVRAATAVAPGPHAGSAASLSEEGSVAASGGAVGSGVLWEEARWMGRAIAGPPIEAAIAAGLPVAAPAAEVEEARARLLERVKDDEPSAIAPREAPARSGGGAIAIIGIGCRFPDAPNKDAYWQNLVSARSSIREVPIERWDPALYYDADPAAPDKTYAKIGAFITDFVFEPKRFRIPPKVAKQIDPVQQLTLAAVADALKDAGLQVDAKAEGKAFDRERTAVILGNSLGGEVKDDYALRVAWPAVRAAVSAQPEIAAMNAQGRDALLARLEVAWKQDLHEIDEDSMPGELANVVAGRITNAFDLAGANFTVDAACASSMAAIQAAVKGLRDGDFDLALTGGADRSMNVSTYVKFSKIGALSADLSAPFDERANGFVMGEGVGVLVLKRLEDALHDGDRVYAIIRGIGASSDGKGKGITAPNPDGQRRALERAYAHAGVDPATVDLFECHGTSTSVGDKIEIEALSAFVGPGRRGDRGPARIGSVKSMIGHLKSAAGAASIIKAALGLHHGVLLPSANFKNARADVLFDTIPLQVQTVAEPWPDRGGPRRAGVSAFGFGGTNFHIVLESWSGQAAPASVFAGPTRVPEAQRPAPPPAAQGSPPPPVAAARQVAAPIVARHEPRTLAPILDRPAPPAHLWATSGDDRPALIANLERLLRGEPAPWNPSAPIRIAAWSLDAEEKKQQLERAIALIRKDGNLDLLRARSIYVEDTPVNGKVALCFSGQGSQYVGMGLDLAEEFEIIRQTFDEADETLLPELGFGVRDLITLRPGESLEVKEERLRRTEYSQPATLAIDVAILRLLACYGVYPDMVAGHSLGEYAAAVAAGILTFRQALLAVTARGREMANIRIDDPGKMAGIAASTEDVEEVLAEVDGYVVAANKNCPTQTVIAGASDAVDEACERFKARGVTVHMLAVSHAFHSAIVAPASAPLRTVLQGLGLQPPRRPITTNVTSDWYPTGPDSAPEIVDILARQISAPVEWTAQVERMYEAGARIFVEVGPKRAITGFVVAILKRRPHRAIYTNHPKRGGTASMRDALAAMLVLGLPISDVPSKGIPDLFALPAPRRATTQAIAAQAAIGTEALPDLHDGILRIVAQTSGYAIEELDPTYELEADLGIDTVKQAEIFSVVRATYGIQPDTSFSFSDHKTLQSVVDWAAAKVGAKRPAAPVPPAALAPIAADDAVTRFLVEAARAGVAGRDAEGFARALLPAVQGLLAAAFDAARITTPAPAAPPVVAAPVVATPIVALPTVPASPAPRAAPYAPVIVCTGASIGLPGGDDVFGADNIAAVLRGENRITQLGERARAFLDLGLVRLAKDPRTGEGSFVEVDDVSQVIRLAGVKSHFDLADYGMNADRKRALDITTQLAIAAAVEALRDAGLPMVAQYRMGSGGRKHAAGYALPEPLRDDTGVVFGSAFPGYDQLVRHLPNKANDGDGHFDRRFLFQVLSMGHSQLAEWVGARGPNSAVNAACASTTQAIAIAQDWIRTGRCRRVIVVGADDVTGEALLPWIGGGFMAAGAASTEDRVEHAALPFDRRRHGLILGMGAAALVLEREDDARARGVVPIARLLDCVIANSAFHGTRLEPGHIARLFAKLVDDVGAQSGLTPAQIAGQSMFVSHETYTPARGGSAAAEIEALRAAFGAHAHEVAITNTKGLTGHPMGAGIEDTTAVKALQYGFVPPVANFQEPDETLGDLWISRGEQKSCRFAFRLAAGFGSQIALSAWERVATGDDRTDLEARTRWLRQVTGFSHVTEEIVHRTLRAVESDEDRPLALVPGASPAGANRAPATAPAAPARAATPTAAAAAPTAAPAPIASPAASPGRDALAAELIDVVARKTGYAPDEIELDYELEADLGIDTVKQAEIFSEIRDRYGIARDDSFRLSSTPTVRALAGWISDKLEGDGPPAETPALPAETPALPAETPAPPATRQTPTSAAQVLSDLVHLVADRTGYAPAEIDPTYELEADLGIDTVKQAEIFSALRDRYGIARDDGFKLADYPTVEKLADWLSSQLDVPPAGALRPPKPLLADDDDPGDPTGRFSPAPSRADPDREVTAPATPSRTAAPPPPRLDQPSFHPPADLTSPDVLADLLAVIAEKTGYEPSEIEPSFELEADLGIDTVKQAEIFSAVRDRHGIDRDDNFRLSDYPTVEKLAAWLSSKLPDAPPVPVLLDEGALDAPTRLATALGAAADSLDAPSAPPARLPDPGDRGFVAEEFDLDPQAGRYASPALPESFRLRRPILVERPLVVDEPLTGLRIRVVGTDSRAEAIRVEIVNRGGEVDTSGAGDVDLVVDAADDVMTSFEAAKLVAGRQPKRWLCVTRLPDLDGAHARDRAFTDGARGGFAKSLGREWTDTHARVLGLASNTPDEAAAAAVCDELVSRVHVDEVFRKGNDRRVVAYRSEPIPRPGMLFDAPTVLITGGGRGISARIALELARRGPVRLGLVGRGPVGDAPLDLPLERDRLRAEITADGGRATPAELDRRLAPLRAADEVRRTLERLEELGAEVRYFRCDLADREAVFAMVGEVEHAFGPIDVLLHGAGVEESRPLTEKDESAFRRVFDGKARGGLALIERLGAAPYLISMGSVAGRFGNAGQVDYAAANEAMARLCLSRPRSLHIDWTAWDEVGMAVRGGMRSLLSQRGVELLPADAGAALLVDLVSAGVTGELVVAGKLGEFSPPTGHPLLDRLEWDGDAVRATRELTTARDGWILDHAIDGVPVLPGVIGLEMMVATATYTRAGFVVGHVHDVHFSAPVKLYRDEPTTITVEAVPEADGYVRCALFSERALRTGRVQRTEHFTARVELRTDGRGPEVPALPEVPFFPDETIDATEIYRRFFHGPIFQVLTGVQGVARDLIVAEATTEPAAISELLFTEPLSIEAAFQAAGLHRMLIDREQVLPASIGRVWWARAKAPNETLLVTAHRRGDTYDIDIDGTRGPLLRLRDVGFVVRGPLEPDLVFTEPEEPRPDVLRHVESARRVDGVATASAGPSDDPSPWLDSGEIATLRARGTDRRVADRVAGRIAAKRALSQLTGVSPGQIRVTSASTGEPLAVVPGWPKARVSITHRQGRAVAVAVAVGRVGVDVEHVEARDPAWANDWFSDAERQALDPASPARLTVAWAIKEAVLKALGTGLTVPARDIRIIGLGVGTADVTLDGEARRVWTTIGEGTIDVRWALESGDEVRALVRIAG